MLTQDEHREACRVYMQKYRSKPENREKIRQQNAEYRKRKKQESIRQVSEIGSLEHTLDSQNARILQLEKQLVESNFKVTLFEKEKLIPKNYLNIINDLRTQLSNASNEIEEQKSKVLTSQQQNVQLQQQLTSLQLQQQQQLELINAFGNGTSSSPMSLSSSTSSSPILSQSSTSSSSFSLPPTPTSSSIPIQPFYNNINTGIGNNGIGSPFNILNSINNNINHHNNNNNEMIDGSVHKKQKTTTSSIESFSNHSTPPSSPSLQQYLPNSPTLPHSLILSPSMSPSTIQQLLSSNNVNGNSAGNSAISTPHTSNSNLASLVPSDDNNALFKPHFTLDLLCDVLQNEKSLQLPSTSSMVENSNGFKTTIDFVLNNSIQQQQLQQQ